MISAAHSKYVVHLLFALGAAATVVIPPPVHAQVNPTTYSGWEGQLDVEIPRIDTTVTIDGALDEHVWSHAAVLTGFSQYQPVDGRPAEEPTTVYVWYSPNAIHFGIRAEEIHGSDQIRATQANRDNISSEDQIQILLDTYDDRRTAFLFSVNPLGVQADGTRSDAFAGGAGGTSATGGGSRTVNFLDGNVDLNPDYVFDSKGRLTDFGYEVEVRIPFKSLRYQDADVQNWGLHILRRSMHSGFQDSWAPAVRARASFLGQAGELRGLHGLQRGLVLEVTPTATGRLDGYEKTSGDWAYDSGGELSADVRWGMRQNLSLNGTINPDFSQVEADVGQVTLNERFALFYPEKRPFFLDGLELFDTPGQLIYTRQIAAPVAGAKLAGKAGEWNIATILAADDSVYSATGSTPVFAVARIRRDFSRSATVGGVLTAREDGSNYSRLLGVDTRLYHDRMYYIEIQGVGSWAEHSGAGTNGTMFGATWDRTGRSWGFHYTIGGVSPDFEAAAGFVNRTNLITTRASNRLTGYGGQGALLETASTFITLERSWAWDGWGDAWDGGAIEGRESLSPSAKLRGGWNVGGSLNRSFFAYDPADYVEYSLDAGTISSQTSSSFVVPGVEDNQWTGEIRVTTPTWQMVTATAGFGFGRTPLFREAAPGSARELSATIDLRPTQALRATFQVTRLELNRVSNDSRFSTETIPRLKLEYQITHDIFVRVIGQYTARELAALENRDGVPILIDGEATTATEENLFQTDWLFSYRPVPGTLLYLGYSASFEEPESFRYRDLRRQVDGFFAKISYTIRS
ncbi:MAG TPA: DUF5916 domain-containing protein [Rhodothermales bacterium]|nr:DUF5916 domain-containing protein [Rhodothermales bacterium]